MPDYPYSDDLLRDYAEGLVDQATAERIEAYLQTSPRCERFVQAVEAELLQNMLAQAGRDESNEAYLAAARQEVDQALQTPPAHADDTAGETPPRVKPLHAPSQLRRTWLPYLVAAGLALLIGLAIYQQLVEDTGEALLAIAPATGYLQGTSMSMGPADDQSRVSALIKAKQYEDASAILRPVVQAIDTTQALSGRASRQVYFYGVCRLHGGEPSASIAWLRAVRQNGQPQALRVWAGKQLALAYYEAGQSEAAQRVLQDLLSEELVESVRNEIQNALQSF